MSPLPITCPLPDCVSIFAGEGALDDHLRHRHRLEPAELVAARAKALGQPESPLTAPQLLVNTVHQCPHCPATFAKPHGVTVHMARMHTTNKNTAPARSARPEFFDVVTTQEIDETNDELDEPVNWTELDVMLDDNELELLDAHTWLNRTTPSEWLVALVGEQLALIAKDKKVRKIIDLRSMSDGG